MSFILLMILFFSQAQETKNVSFLVGCWEKKEGNETIKETWTMRGDSFRGHGQTFNKDQQVFWENIAIFKKNKSWIYQPAPNGKDSVAFAHQNCSTVDTICANFVNLKHDFPQQIKYSQKLKNKQLLNIQLSGDKKARQFTLKAVSCEDTSPK